MYRQHMTKIHHVNRNYKYNITHHLCDNVEDKNSILPPIIHWQMRLRPYTVREIIFINFNLTSWSAVSDWSLADTILFD